jgi:hypothetical protein
VRKSYYVGMMADNPTFWERFAEWFISHILWRFTGDKVLDWLPRVLGSGALATVLPWLINHFRPVALPVLVVLGTVIFVGLMVISQSATQRKRNTDKDVSKFSGGVLQSTGSTEVKSTGPRIQYGRGMDTMEDEVEVGTLTWGTRIMLRPPFQTPPTVDFEPRSGQGTALPEAKDIDEGGFTITIKNSSSSGTWTWRARGKILKPS